MSKRISVIIGDKRHEGVLIDSSSSVQQPELDLTPARAPASTIAPEEMTRITIEIPLSLHIKIKTGCIKRRIKIKDAVAKAIEEQFKEW